jgi:hypothetical protein
MLLCSLSTTPLHFLGLLAAGFLGFLDSVLVTFAMLLTFGHRMPMQRIE